jgi:elongation factor G
MDRVGADFFRGVQMIKDRLKLIRCQFRYRWQGRDFKGVVDLVRMKAIIWNDESLGAEYTEIEIPADLVDETNEYREKMIEEISSHDDA